ncbi:MAG TPA: hypothetical protein VGM99_05430, partial [Candidatus Cybelea sp.]
MKCFAAAACAAVVFATISPGIAASPEPSLVTSTTYDNHHGFDFLFGTWTTHYRILRKRLAHDTVWYDCYGRSTIRPFWNGSANLEDGDLRCPQPRGYTHGMTLRLYDAATHQWSLYWGTTRIGLGLPQQATQAGHRALQMVAKERRSPRFEQAFSTDHGRNWETNWT